MFLHPFDLFTSPEYITGKCTNRSTSTPRPHSSTWKNFSPPLAFEICEEALEFFFSVFEMFVAWLVSTHSAYSIFFLILGVYELGVFFYALNLLSSHFLGSFCLFWRSVEFLPSYYYWGFPWNVGRYLRANCEIWNPLWSFPFHSIIEKQVGNKFKFNWICPPLLAIRLPSLFCAFHRLFLLPRVAHNRDNSGHLSGVPPSDLMGGFSKARILRLASDIAGISARNCTKMEMVQRYLMYC